MKSTRQNFMNYRTKIMKIKLPRYCCTLLQQDRTNTELKMFFIWMNYSTQRSQYFFKEKLVALLLLYLQNFQHRQLITEYLFTFLFSDLTSLYLYSFCRYLLIIRITLINHNKVKLLKYVLRSIDQQSEERLNISVVP